MANNYNSLQSTIPTVQTRSDFENSSSSSEEGKAPQSKLQQLIKSQTKVKFNLKK